MNPVTLDFDLLDERSTPGLRATLGGLLARADSADIAVARIRLAQLDLSEAEVRPRLRVLLGQLDAGTLLDAGAARPDAVARLIAWARSGRLQVRSAGIGAWTPDFSVYRAGETVACLLGAHYLGSPHLTVGPSFTAVSTDPSAAALLAGRFDELWSRAHDVLPAILEVLERVRAAPTRE